MSKYKPLLTFLFYLILVTVLGNLLYFASEETSHDPTYRLILNPSEYNDSGMSSTWEKLSYRFQVQPFNLIALIVFVCAIIHTLISHQFNILSSKLRKRNIDQKKEIIDSFGVEMLHFMGEVEVIFGIWVIPLMVFMSLMYDWSTAISYLSARNYIEPLFVIVIMAIASTRPIVRLTEDCLKFIAKFGKESVTAWWWTVLTIGPLAGSFITEPGAMTLSALILSRHFYRYHPRPKFAYATLGLLFTNISVGGVFTSFAAPPVLMVSQKWEWDTSYMMQHFGWKAVMGILIANTLYFFLFRTELRRMEEFRLDNISKETKALESEQKIPFWITLVNIVFLAWMVVHNHYPVIFLGSFLLFLGFQQVTATYQSDLNLRMPLLVGFFLAGLIVHGSLQGWWISPLIGDASENVLMLLSVTLTAFTDNAQITFLATLIPDFSEVMKYAVVAGAVTGGGLTVIANAPNPLGQALLGKHFSNGVSTGGLFLAALTPTIIMAASFWLFKSY